MSMSKYATYEEYLSATEGKREKPVVSYSERFSPIIIGASVSIIPLDHPAEYLNGDIAYTSAVVAIDGDNFETRNTRYVYKAD